MLVGGCCFTAAIVFVNITIIIHDARRTSFSNTAVLITHTPLRLKLHPVDSRRIEGGVMWIPRLYNTPQNILPSEELFLRKNH